MSEEESKLSASLAELRRRKVFRVGVGYAVGAFVFLQVLSAFFSALELTPATQRLILVLTLAGFPVALFLAWAYDVTPRGIERTVESEHARSSRTLELSIIVVLAVVVGGVGYLIYRPGATTTVSTAQAEIVDRSIAVLPFTNMSDDAANDYFGDGLAEEILNVLATVPNLRVAARTSSFAYKGRNEDVRRIGNELNVATVLEGSVRKNGDKVRVTVQLINVADGFHIWSQNFDRELSDIFAIQDEIAAAIADALKVKLLGEAAANAQRGGTKDVAAYDLWLLGRHNMQQRDEAGLNAAIGYFEKALAADPQFARAWSGLADAYNLLIGYGNLTPGVALPKAEAAAQKALALDPKLAAAHASLGLIRTNQGRTKEGIAELEKAIALDPEYAPAWVWYGTALGTQKRDAEKLAAYEKAFQLDPTLPPAVSNLAGDYFARGRYRDAIPLAERMARLRASDSSAWHSNIGDALLALGAPAEAMQAQRRALDLDAGNFRAMTGAARAALALGDLAEAARWIERARALAPQQFETVKVEYDMLLAEGATDRAATVVRGAFARTGAASPEPAYLGYALVAEVRGRKLDAATATMADLEKRFGAYTPELGAVELGPYVAQLLRRAKRERDADDVIAKTLAWIDARAKDGVQRSDHQYAAAQCLALSGRAADAVAALTRARQYGWIDAAFARKDPLLAALKDDPGFNAVLETADAAVVAQRDALAQAALPGYVPPAPAPKVTLAASELERVVGVYVGDNDNTIREVRRTDDGVALAVGDLAPTPLIPLGALAFRDAERGDVLTFVLGPDGAATHARVRGGGKETRYKRVPFTIPVQGRADPAKYPDYPGSYAFDIGFKVDIKLDGKRLMGRQDVQPWFELVPERDDVFFVPGAALRLVFVRGADGAVNALRLQQVDSQIDGPRAAAAPTP